MMNNLPELSNVAAFDLYARRTPTKIWQPALNFLAQSQDAMETKKLRTVSGLVACHPKKWDWKARRLDFYTFGSFRSFMPTVDQVARTLAPLFQEYGILPLIIPIQTVEWNEMLATDALPFLRVQSAGLLVFNKERI